MKDKLRILGMGLLTLGILISILASGGCIHSPVVPLLRDADLSSKDGPAHLLVFADKYSVRDEVKGVFEHYEVFYGYDMRGHRYRIPFQTQIVLLGRRTRAWIAYNPRKHLLASVIRKSFKEEEKITPEKFTAPREEYSSGPTHSCVVIEAQPPGMSKTKIIATAPVIHGLTWSPDWERLAFLTWTEENGYSLVVHPAEEGTAGKMVPLPGSPLMENYPFNNLYRMGVSWIDSNRVAVTVLDKEKSVIALANLDTKEVTPLIEGSSAVFVGGQTLAYLADDRVALFDMSTKTSRTLRQYSGRYCAGWLLSVSRDGRFLVTDYWDSGSILVRWLGKAGHAVQVFDLHSVNRRGSPRRVFMAAIAPSSNIEVHAVGEFAAEWECLLPPYD